MEQNPVFGNNGQGSLYFVEEQSIADIVEIVRKRLERIKGHNVKFLCIIGIARSGTTILQVLASQFPSVICSEFQPIKYLLRYGENMADSFTYDRFSINGSEGTIILKETLGPERTMECTLDPVGILMKAGIHAKNISALYILRNPIKAFFSWYSLLRSSQASKYVVSQNALVESFKQYINILPQCIPFCYEILEQRPEYVLKQLFKKLGIIADYEEFNLELDEQLVKNKNCWNEGSQPHYWNGVIAPIIGRKRFEYVNRPIPVLPPQYAKELEEFALPQYECFMKLTRETFQVS